MKVSPRKRRAARRVASWIALLGLMAVLVAVLRVPLLMGVAHIMTVDEPPVPSDLIYVLNGDIHTRPFRAAALYRSGYAPRVAFPVEEEAPATKAGLFPSSSATTLSLLHRQGVPDSAITVIDYPDGVSSTIDEAKALRSYVARRRIRRVLVVTTAYHGLRAGWLLRRELKGSGTEVIMIGTAHPQFDLTNWWRTEAGLVTYANEFLKLVHNFLFENPPR